MLGWWYQAVLFSQVSSRRGLLRVCHHQVSHDVCFQMVLGNGDAHLVFHRGCSGVKFQVVLHQVWIGHVHLV